MFGPSIAFVIIGLVALSSSLHKSAMCSTHLSLVSSSSVRIVPSMFLCSCHLQLAFFFRSALFFFQVSYILFLCLSLSNISHWLFGYFSLAFSHSSLMLLFSSSYFFWSAVFTFPLSFIRSRIFCHPLLFRFSFGRWHCFLLLCSLARLLCSLHLVFTSSVWFISLNLMVSFCVYSVVSNSLPSCLICLYFFLIF